ncbi:hypothetical protein J437_LFUL001915 [Ladona fulva]|uniref:thioredoxin-dependent peroxiredoxin n=1 Tax=Ladona fulva TaxID=123851 RepID=A0A8K0JZ24_LADFU|nr:hypothetical protein J437_LFUL001915 [Ladona fulva]
MDRDDNIWIFDIDHIKFHSNFSFVIVRPSVVCQSLASGGDRAHRVDPLNCVELSSVKVFTRVLAVKEQGSQSSQLSLDTKTMNCLQPQKPAPEFAGVAVIDGQFKDIKLSDYKGKYVVLFFYPLDFTFVCPTEIIAFSERADEFRKIGCEVIGASCDSQINTPRKEGGLGQLNIPLLADKSGHIAKAYGVLNEETGIPFRGLFIIDGKQSLRQITINDLPVGRCVDETLRLVQAFQFTDEHGEVCPANWKPGSKTMKPNPEDSKSFFKTMD